MTQQALQNSRRFQVGASPCELGPASILVGRQTIPYADLTGFGVAVLDPSGGVGGVRVRKVGTHRQLFLYLAYRSGGKPKHVAVIAGDDAGLSAEGAAFVAALRSRVPDRWVGEGPHLEIRKRLGISNSGIVVAVVAAVVVACVVTAILIVMGIQSRHGGDTAHPAHPSGAHGR